MNIAKSKNQFKNLNNIGNKNNETSLERKISKIDENVQAVICTCSPISKKFPNSSFLSSSNRTNEKQKMMAIMQDIHVTISHTELSRTHEKLLNQIFTKKSKKFALALSKFKAPNKVKRTC